jgi:hypothetical protein
MLPADWLRDGMRRSEAGCKEEPAIGWVMGEIGGVL